MSAFERLLAIADEETLGLGRANDREAGAGPTARDGGAQ
jgi:hypothetical protein